MRCLRDKKFRMALQLIVSKICQGQTQQCTQSAADFIQIGTPLKTRREVNPIFGWSLTSSRKTRILKLSCGVVCVLTSLAVVMTENRLVCRRCVQISCNVADGNRRNRVLFTGQKKTKFRQPLKLSLLRGSRQNIPGAAPENMLTVLQISSKSVHFRRSYNRTRKRWRPLSCPVEYFHYRLFAPIIYSLAMLTISYMCVVDMLACYYFCRHSALVAPTRSCAL